MYNITNSQTLKAGRFIVHIDTIEKDGKEYTYSFTESSDSVAVLSKKDDKYIFIKQYRHSIENYVLEIPGGAVDKEAESFEAVAKREIQEETGFIVSNIEKLGDFYPAVGSSKEICHLYYATCGERSGQHLDPLEDIEVVLLDKDEIEKKIAQGIIMQGSALVAWLLKQQQNQQLASTSINNGIANNGITRGRGQNAD